MLLPFGSVVIPNANIFTLLAVGVFCIFGLFLLFLLLKRKLSLEFIPFAVGAASYMVFFLLAEQQLLDLVLGEGSALRNPMIANPALYMLFVGFTSAFFVEGGRYLLFFFLKKWYPLFSAPISVALGYAALESILLIGVKYIVYAWLAIVNNTQVLSGAAIQITDRNLADLFLTLSSAVPSSFLFAGLERMLYTMMHIGLTSLIWYSITKPGCTYLFPASILLHAVFVSPLALQDIKVLNSQPLYFICLLIVAVLSYAIAYSVKRADIRGKSQESDPFGIF